MQVEIVYGDAAKQTLLAIELAEKATVRQAIEESKILQQHPELELSDLVVGIFSRKCQLTTVLKSGDRVEIYRSLVIDPKEARRIRAIKRNT